MTYDLPGGLGARLVFRPVDRPLGSASGVRDPYLVLMAALVAEARANGDPPALVERGDGRTTVFVRILDRQAPLAAILSAPLGVTPPATYIGITEAGDPNRKGAVARAEITQRPRAA